MPSRSRQLGNQSVRVYFYDNGTEVYDLYTDASKGEEQIDWISGVNCYHRRSEYSWTPISVSQRVNGANHWGATLPRDVVNSVGSKTVQFRIPSWLDIQQKVENPVGNNLVVDLLEVADVKALALSLRKDAQTLIRRPLDLIAKRVVKKNGGTGYKARPQKDVEDRYLEAQFGYLPLVSTITKLVESVRKYNSFADRLSSRSGKWNSIRFKKTASFQDTIYFPLNGYEYKTISKWSETKRFTCKASWAYPQNFPRLRLLTDYLGLNVSPDDFWNVIPLSFVVDWVVDIGGALENLSTGTLSPSFQIKDSYYSTKVEWEAQYLAYEPATWHVPATYKEFAKGHGKIYSRNVCLPPYRDWDILNPSLSVGKALSGAALANQRLRK